MNIGNQIKKLRTNAGIKQAEMAKALETGYTTISNYETGYSTPDIETLSRIADYFDVSLDFLIGGKDNIITNDELGFAIIKPRPGQKIVSVNVLGRIAAGVPLEAVEEIIDTEEIVLGESDSVADYFGLKVRGDSMAPRIQNNDVVICKKQSVVENGEIGVILINGCDATLKRVKKLETGITLIPDNPNFEPTFFTAAEIENLPVVILGKVIELRGKL